MNTSELVTYAVWLSIKGKRAQKLRETLKLLSNHLEIKPRWYVRPRTGHAAEPSLHLAIVPGFHLIHIEQHCSPGDICGALKQLVLTDPGDQVMAIRLAKDSYLPHHGMNEPPGVNYQRLLSEFMAVPAKFHLMQRATGSS